MSKYDEMSDFEINKLVCVALGFNVEKWSMHNIGKVDVIATSSGGLDSFEQIPDYCNNPADMWPIIVENKISMLNQDNDEGWCVYQWLHDEAECWHQSPLRAAAIVFLMMKDAE